jgi:hypothetical protein
MSLDASIALAYAPARPWTPPDRDPRTWLLTRLRQPTRSGERRVHDSELRSQMIDTRGDALWRVGFRGF